MFNKNFFPTSREIAEQMLFGLDLKNKVVLEPHGGKGDLIETERGEGGYGSTGVK